jgi:hypothetical protein
MLVANKISKAASIPMSDNQSKLPFFFTGR